MGEETVEAAMKDMDMPLRVVLGECMRIEGMSVPRSFDNDAIKAAFSTVSLPGILSNVANKKLLQAYNAQPIIATRLCTTGDLTDFKENQRFRLTDVGDLQPVGADGEIKDSALTEEAAKNQLDTYAKKFCLTRKMIINDDLGAFLKVPTAMGNRAARLVDQLFFKRLMSNPTCVDGKPLFGRDHKNLLSGANSALSADSLKKAIQLFIDQTDADGQPISVEPSILLVPTALKHLAIELTRGATLMMSGGPDNTVRPAINVLADENLAIARRSTSSRTRTSPSSRRRTSATRTTRTSRRRPGTSSGSPARWTRSRSATSRASALRRWSAATSTSTSSACGSASTSTSESASRIIAAWSRRPVPRRNLTAARAGFFLLVFPSPPARHLFNPTDTQKGSSK